MVRTLILILAILVSTAAATSWYTYFQQRSNVQEYREVSGTIVGFENATYVTHELKRGRRESFAVPVIEFDSQLGRHRGTPSYFSPHPERPVARGDKIPVYFNPKKPTSFVAFSRTVPPIGPLILTVFAVGIGTLTYRVWKKSGSPR